MDTMNERPMPDDGAIIDGAHPHPTAPIWRVAAPNYANEWLRLRRVVSVLGMIGMGFLIVLAFGGFGIEPGTPSNPGTRNLLGGASIAPILEGVGVVLLFVILFSFLGSWGYRLIVEAGNLLSKILTALFSPVLAILPRRVREPVENAVTRFVERILPAEKTDRLDAEIAGRLPPESFPELWVEPPPGLALSPLIDGRLPDGSSTTLFLRRLISRRLVAVAVRRGAFVAIGFLIIAAIMIPVAGLKAAASSYDQSRLSAFQAAQQKAGQAWQAKAQAAQKAAYNKANASKVAAQKAYQDALAAWKAKKKAVLKKGNAVIAAYNKQVDNVNRKNDTIRQARQAYINKHGNTLTRAQESYLQNNFKSIPAPKTPDMSKFKDELRKLRDNPPAEPPAAYAPAQQVNVTAPPKPAILSQSGPSGTIPAAWMPTAATSLRVGLICICLALIGFGGETMLVVRDAEIRAGDRYRMPTKESFIRWKRRAAARMYALHAWRVALDNAVTRLSASPVFRLGTATGFMRASGAMTGPSPGTDICIDSESLGQHVLAYGGTGEGKTRNVLRPLARQILSSANPAYGMLAADAKGVLWQDVRQAAVQAGRGDDIVIVGPGRKSINPLAGLDPDGFAHVIRSLISQKSGGRESGNSGFFADSAALVLGHCARIAQGVAQYNIKTIYDFAVEQHGGIDGQAVESGNGKTAIGDGPAPVPYFREPGQIDLRTAIQEIRENALDGGLEPGLAHAIGYLEKDFLALPKDTRGSIIATITSLLDPIISDQRFQSLISPESGAMDASAEALSGKIVLLAIGSASGGLGARLVVMAIKSAFFRAARIREEQNGDKFCQSNPAVILVDECQETVTADMSGMSDSSFFNVARSAGICGVYATQTHAALRLALGEEAAANLVQQFRTRIYLRTEDKPTIDEMISLAGEHLRCHVAEDQHHESIAAWEMSNLREYLPDAEIDQQAAVDVAQGRGRTFAGGNESPEFGPVMLGQTVAGRDIFPPMPTTPVSGIDNSGTGAERKRSERIRIQDLTRKWLADHNEVRAAISGAEIMQMGRAHALIVAQRAGITRVDIARIGDHDADLPVEMPAKTSEAAPVIDA